MEIAENGKRKAITYGWVIMDKGKGTLKAGVPSPLLTLGMCKLMHT